MALWTVAELEQWAQSCHARLCGAYGDISGISIDSRAAQKGEAFFAVQGERFNGHDYVKQAVANGAALLVIDRAHQALAKETEAPCFIAADVPEALRALAGLARARLKPQAKVAAITGSAGKTTAKEMLAQALKPFSARIHKNPASFNNHWGVPLTLARMPRGADYAIFEIGMNHAGEITPLVKLVRPHLTLITCIAAAHMGHFRSLEEIAAAKAEIFGGAASGGCAVLNKDDAFFAFLAAKAEKQGLNIRSFGKAADADYSLKQLSGGHELECRFDGVHKTGKRLSLAAPGRHMLINACAVLAAAGEMAINSATEAKTRESYWRQAIEAVEAFQPQSGRGARCRLLLPAEAGGGGFTLIDESYNANPASMRAALAVLGQESGRKIAVLGDMLELGAAAPAEHEAIAAALPGCGAARVFFIGSAMSAAAAKLKNSGIHVSCHKTAEEVIPLLRDELKDGDCLMVKSSNSIRTSAIVKALRERFPAAS